MRIRRKGLAIAVVIAALGPIVPLHAEQWPSRPIQVVVPQGAGGSTDAVARLVSQNLSERVGQPVVIDNRAGAGGTIGVTLASRAPADGYTLLFGSNTTMAANQFLYSTFNVDPLKDFIPLAMVGDAPFVLAVPASSPYKTVRDLVAAAKASPGKLSYGAGTSSALLCAELFKAAAGIDLLKVMYKASTQALTDLIAGRLDVVCEPLSSSSPQIKANRLRALATTGSVRTPLAPELETVQEAGVKGMEYSAWVAFFAPKGVPGEIASRLSEELVAIVKDPEIGAKVRAIGFVPKPGDAGALMAVHQAEVARVADTVKAAGIRPE